jgi:HEAT repeat protein
MAKGKQTLEARLARLRQLRDAPRTPEALKELRTALGDASNFVVEEAAGVIGASGLTELAPQLTAAFERFFENPEKSDKLCRAKIAIADALNRLEFDDERVFWRGARYVQLEPVWGGHQDTAAPLRVACAFALVRLHADGAAELLVDLLADPEKAARIGAAQALAYSETDAAGLLLRFKARLGDAEPDVIAECFAGLLKLHPEEGVPFVAEFVHAADEAIQESALLSLGDSRRREAFEVLKVFWEEPCEDALQDTVLMAMALLRLPAANDFLIGLVESGSRAAAPAAVNALALHRYDARLKQRTAEAVAKTGQASLQAHFEERFRAKE